MLLLLNWSTAICEMLSFVIVNYHAIQGVFWFNPSETFVDIADGGSAAAPYKQSRWLSESGEVDVFLLPGPDVASIYRQYTALTGTVGRWFCSASLLFCCLVQCGEQPLILELVPVNGGTCSLYFTFFFSSGTQQLPPMFSLGYHQCRWNYRDERDVASVEGMFEQLDYPVDVVWLDIEHTDGKRYFTVRLHAHAP